MYDNHDSEWQKLLSDPSRLSQSRGWLDPSTLDFRRHSRMRSLFDPLATPDSSWLTVGDGRYGSDAIHFKPKVASVHATDYFPELLQLASKDGLLDSWSRQNAEDLSFPDNSFDYVFVKEALHHCPRPWLALYECYRVARVAVLILEPYDQWGSPLSFLRLSLKRLLRVGNRTTYNHEKVGNFVYNFTPRDLEKFMLGMHHTSIYHNSLNDYYDSSMSYVSRDRQPVKFSCLLLVFRLQITFQNFLCLLRLRKPALYASIIPKVPFSVETKRRLWNIGWRHAKLPSNPYLKH